MRHEIRKAVLVAVLVVMAAVAAVSSGAGRSEPGHPAVAGPVAEASVVRTEAAVRTEVGGLRTEEFREMVADLDLLNDLPDDHPMVTAAAAAQRTTLDEGEMRAVLAEALFSGSRLEEALAVSRCESSLGTAYWHLTRRGDGGMAFGPFQIHWFPEDGWEGWAMPALRAGYITAAEYGTPEDPVVNAKVARYIIDRRGHWGGTGGWATCAANAGVE